MMDLYRHIIKIIAQRLEVLAEQVARPKVCASLRLKKTQDIAKAKTVRWPSGMPSCGPPLENSTGAVKNRCPCVSVWVRG